MARLGFKPLSPWADKLQQSALNTITPLPVISCVCTCPPLSHVHNLFPGSLIKIQLSLEFSNTEQVFTSQSGWVEQVVCYISLDPSWERTCALGKKTAMRGTLILA